ncbi:hypothetical protein H7A76_24445 [Pseudomonas sp. MSSRFD41]|nr:hypothetical protein [Pseudomonas sp. MSSRFD41]
MSATTEIKVRCQHCRNWFDSAIWIADRASFESSMLFGNLQQCRHCGKMTGCNKENFKARFEDGGFLGDYTA